MNVKEYELVRKSSTRVLESDSFITKIISLMPDFVKEECSYVTKKKNEIVLHKSSPVEFAYLTISGEIAVLNEFESGKIFEPFIIRHSDFSGVVEIILNMEEIISTNIAISDVEYIMIPARTLRKWLDQNHEITKYVLHSVCFNFRGKMEESGESVILNSMYSFVNHLINNATYSEKTKLYVLNESRERTSIRTGVNLRTLYRHIKKLKQEELIDIVKRKIVFTKQQQKDLYDYYKKLRN
jgi:CRP/FNR family cyclic AMP-dependent transcriptional regulator